jgi:hypothetical protein
MLASVIALGAMAQYSEGLSQAEQAIPTSLTAPGHQRSHAPSSPAGPEIVQSYGRLPLSFEANHGQSDEQVKFLSRGSGYNLFLTPTEAVISLRQVSNWSESRISSNAPYAALSGKLTLTPILPAPPIHCALVREKRL